jgi:DNA-binding phage protein
MDSKQRKAPTARTLLAELEAVRQQKELSKEQLALRAGLPSSMVRKLFTTPSNPTLDTVEALAHSLGLKLTFVPSESPESVNADADTLRTWLAHYGAPLYGASVAHDVPTPEVVLSLSLALARQDSSVARALPVVFYQNRDVLNFARLRELANERGQGRVLGFFLELTSRLSGDRSFARAARPLRPAERRHNAIQFFSVHSKLERRISELRTPEVAKRWDFRMNMDLESFASMFQKAMSQ